MGTFVDDSAVSRDGERLTATLAEDWAIWGPNGGYISAIALRAAGMTAPQDHRPVTFSSQYLSAARFDRVDIVVKPAKQGKSSWCLNVELHQDDRCFLQAQIWTSNRSAGPAHSDVKAPDVPPPEALKDIEAYFSEGQTRHPFWRHFDTRPIHHLLPGETDPRGAASEHWQRLRDFQPTDPFLSASRYLLLIDTTPWPTFYQAQPEPPKYIAPSLDLMVWFHQSGVDTDWLLVAAHADTSGGGLIHGGGRIWAEDGRLLATGGSQLLVVGG